MRILSTDGNTVTEDIVDEPSPVTGIRRLDPDMLDGGDNPYVPSIPQ
ncbi:hypothetical protein [Bifidobacterium bifidum]|nr:hypothetical protein [Bifidobacterium bifidum]